MIAISFQENRSFPRTRLSCSLSGPGRAPSCSCEDLVMHSRASASLPFYILLPRTRVTNWFALCFSDELSPTIFRPSFSAGPYFYIIPLLTPCPLILLKNTAFLWPSLWPQEQGMPVTPASWSWSRRTTKSQALVNYREQPHLKERGGKKDLQNHS